MGLSKTHSELDTRKDELFKAFTDFMTQKVIVQEFAENLYTNCTDDCWLSKNDKDALSALSKSFEDCQMFQKTNPQPLLPRPNPLYIVNPSGVSSFNAEPYNGALSTHVLLGPTDVSLALDNEAMFQISPKNKQ